MGQSGPGSDGNEGVLHIPQSYSITGTSPSDCLVSYPGHSLGVGLTQMQSAYFTVPAYWADRIYSPSLRLISSTPLGQSEPESNGTEMPQPKMQFHVLPRLSLVFFLQDYLSVDGCCHYVLSPVINYLYEGYSINKMNFAKRAGNRKHCLQLHFFSRKSIVMSPFMS